MGRHVTDDRLDHLTVFLGRISLQGVRIHYDQDGAAFVNENVPGDGG
jgi:hypothetical protein